MFKPLQGDLDLGLVLAWMIDIQQSKDKRHREALGILGEPDLVKD